MTNDLLLTLARPTFSAEVVQWLATADIDEIMDTYVESFKDAHGIKARWLYGSTITREQFADMFVQLGHDIKAEEQRQRDADARFMAHVEGLGLAAWAAERGIRCELDLWEHDYNQLFRNDPEPYPYEHMVPGPYTMM